MLTILLVKVIL